MNGWQCSLRTSPVHADIELFLWSKAPGGASYLLKDGVVLNVGEGDRYPEPTLRLPRETVESLLEELMFLGFRPKQAAIDKSILDAKREHILDLQKIIFGKEDSRDKQTNPGL